MRPRAHRDVEVLGIVVGFLGVDQGGGTGVHGDVVVLGVGAVGAGDHRLGLLGAQAEGCAVSSRQCSATAHYKSFHLTITKPTPEVGHQL